MQNKRAKYVSETDVCGFLHSAIEEADHEPGRYLPGVR